MKRIVDGFLKSQGKVAVQCIITAIASAAGTTLWQSVLRPKMLDMIEEKQQANKRPIGFRVD